MNISSYSFYPIDSRMYIVVENKKALVIDPCVSKEAGAFLQDRNINEVTILLTHEHYDHISGVNWLREMIENVHVFCSEACGQAIKKPEENLSAYYEILFLGKSEEIREYVKSLNVEPYSCFADETFCEEKNFEWEGHSLTLKETPGHSKGSICIVMDEKVLFSGDTLVTGHDTILRLPGGSIKDFYQITVPYLKGLNSDIVVYPGHGDTQLLCEFIRLLDD